jgi:hypothetical protein
MNDAAGQFQLLEEILEAMLLDNVDVTARGVTRRARSPFRHASDITRVAERKQLLDTYRGRQAKLRAVMERADKQSRTNLASRIARLEDDKSTAEAERDVLIASHKAMLLAVGEMGGMAAWRKFFGHWEAAAEDLRRMKALPSAGVRSFTSGKANTPLEDG